MGQELAYSIHLGSDKNKSKLAKKVAKNNSSKSTSFTNNSIQNAQQLSKVNKHNLRDYDNKKEQICVIYGTDNVVNDVINLYHIEFENARIEYNKNQKRKERRIENYFNYVSKDSKRDLACELIIELGDMNYWENKSEEYKHKMITVYGEQVYDLMKVIPEFKVANAVIHFDESSPHMHVVGVPVKTGYKNGMSKQTGKSRIFTKESLTKIQEEMRTKCIKSFNKVYEQNATLKKKQKGRNQDIKVKDMTNYRELKMQKEENINKLSVANNKSNNLNNSAEKVIKIINNLKNTTFNKDNKIITNEEIKVIKELTNEIKDTTKSIKSVNKLNIIMNDMEEHYEDLIKENNILKRQVEFQNNEIKGLKQEVTIKDKVINKLKSERDKLQEKLYKFKGFWKNIIKHFQVKVLDKDNKFTEMKEILHKENVFNDYEIDLINNPLKKILTEDELTKTKENKLKDKNNKNKK